MGKIQPEFFNKVIYPKLGRKNPAALVRPQHGVDFGVVDLGDKVIVLSTDPFYIAKELGIKKAAWFAVHIIASDVAVSGIAPKFLSIDLNLPPEISDDELIELWGVVDSECNKLDINIITGHTARYAGCNYPMVGGATMFGIDEREKLIIPKARVGDAIIVTKGPAIETTGLLAAYFPDFLEERYGSSFTKKAQSIYYQMSTVKDALIAASVGDVTSMHDATECGVFGGLYEIATHSRVGIRIYLDDMVIQEEVRKTCACFDLDPYKVISEGTLLATVRKNKADSALRALKAAGIPVSIAGEVVPYKEGMNYFSRSKKYKLEHPGVDPFWNKLEECLDLALSNKSRLSFLRKGSVKR